MSAIRVLIVDDTRAFREVLRAIIESEPGFEVIGEATSGKEAIRLFGELEPDVVLMDLTMPVMDGTEATRGR